MGITASNLSTVHGTQKAVGDVSFDVSTGEVLGAPTGPAQRQCGS
jgi:ABC-2 type transport system ATP-binding protein